MGVFFNPLFKKMSEENIKQFELQQYCQISTLTFAKMRRGECVSLETLIKICEYLECDFGDIMTINPPQADPTVSPWENTRASPIAKNKTDRKECPCQTPS